MTKTLKAGVIGYPIKHSKSPLIHGEWLKDNHIDGSYEAIEIHPDDLGNDIRNLINDGYDGFNVTVPHKQNVMALCDEVDDKAEAIGAVNTVQIKNKKLYGTNTDAFGFLENIKQQEPDFSFENISCVVLGAGGAARAVIYALQQAGVKEIILTNRTKEKALELQKMAPEIVSVSDWSDRSNILKNKQFLVNTTSLGMQGQAPLDIDLNELPTDALVNDIVYAPLMTDLLTQAQMRGNKVVTGIGMLLHQARPAFELWTGILPNVDQNLEDQILK